MRNFRIKLAAGLSVAVVSVLGTAQAHAAPATGVRYQCDSRQNLVVARSDTEATVRFIDRTYELKRRPSELGERYGSAKAALIIDGPSAVFVAEDRLQLGTCTETMLTAQLR